MNATNRATRRRALAAASTALLGAVAGCGTLSDSDPTPTERSYETLEGTPVYVDDEVALSLPDAAQSVTEPTEATLLVLPGDSDVDAERAAAWLSDERVVALLGEGGQETWLDWVRSDDFADAFDAQGYGRADPKPDLLVAAAIGDDLTRYNKTWGNDPDDADVLRELDETLADVQTRTPRP